MHSGGMGGGAASVRRRRGVDEWRGDCEERGRGDCEEGKVSVSRRGRCYVRSR